MMPDLGIYAVHVIAAYGTTAILITGIVVISVWRSYRLGRDLERLEKRRASKSDG